MLVVNVRAVLRLGIDAVVARLTANCETIERFYGSSLDAPSGWADVVQSLANQVASLRSRHERHVFAGEVLALRLADAARRADELFQGSPIRILPDHREAFLQPFEEKGRARLADGALNLAGADSRLYLRMVERPAKSRKPQEVRAARGDLPVGRLGGPKRTVPKLKRQPAERTAEGS
jgi:hypothetical protein